MSDELERAHAFLSARRIPWEGMAPLRKAFQELLNKVAAQDALIADHVSQLEQVAQLTAQVADLQAELQRALTDLAAAQDEAREWQGVPRALGLVVQSERPSTYVIGQDERVAMLDRIAEKLAQWRPR